MKKNSSKTFPVNLAIWLWMAWLLSWTVFIWSGWFPKDRFTWYLEVAPGFLGLIFAGKFLRSDKITPLLFVLICIHSVILFVGGKYTYAEVPIGFWLKEFFEMSRNHYDRLGHFIQGFEPAILAREILIRWQAVKRGFWLNFFVVSVCLAFSAFYELIEWWTALLSGEGAQAFLGTQGDIWDTQTDMFLALIGAATALVFLSRWHDRQLQGSSNVRK